MHPKRDPTHLPHNTVSCPNVGVRDPSRRASEWTCRCGYVSNIKRALGSLIWAEEELEKRARRRSHEDRDGEPAEEEAEEACGGKAGKDHSGKIDQRTDVAQEPKTEGESGM